MEDGSHLHELLDSLERGVLSLGDPRTDPTAAIHRLFQSAHNLKSGLAMAGLQKASRRFHGLEDGLDDIRRGRLVWSDAWADAVLDTVDQVGQCLESGTDEALDEVFVAPRVAEEVSSALSPEETSAALRAAALGQGLFRIEKLFLPGLTEEEFLGHLILEDIRDSGTLLSISPGWEAYSRITEPVVVRYLFSSSQTAEELGRLFFDPLIALPVPRSPSGHPGVRPIFRLLVVDDDRFTTRILERALRVFGEVVSAFDGAEGLTKFRLAFSEGKAFDVVVLDLEMPEIDGHGTLRAIREFEESHGIHGFDRCLIYMNTSNADLQKVKTSFRLQADRYFVKPLSVQHIQKKLEETLPWLETRRRGKL